MKSLLLAILAIVYLQAEANIQYWKPQGFGEKDTIHSIASHNNQIFLLSTVKTKQRGSILYILDCEKPAELKVIGKYLFTQSPHKYDMGAISKMIYAQGYLYMVPAGSYETSLFMLDVRDPKNVKLVSEIPLFKGQVIHYVEMPESIFIEDKRLIVQITRGIAVFDISEAGQPKTLHELDGIRALGVKGKHLFYIQRNSYTVHIADLSQKITLQPYFHLKNYKNSYHWAVRFLHQFQHKILLSTTIKENDQFELQKLILNTEKSSDSTLQLYPQITTWNTKTDAHEAVMNDQFLVLREQKKLSIHSILKKEGQLKLITNVELQEPGTFVLHNKNVFICSRNLGLGIISGW